MFIEEAIATLGVPGSIAVVIVTIFTVLQLIGEFIELSGKVSPTFLKVRKILTYRKIKQKEQEELLVDVKKLLSDVNTHYSADNIAKRNDWMKWVNDRAKIYDAKVEELVELKSSLDRIADALADNTKTTDDMFKEACRDRIINFASKVTKPLEIVSREEFQRIFKVYAEYEAFLAARHEPNGEVDTNYSVILENYAERLKTHNFLEDMRDKIFKSQS